MQQVAPIETSNEELPGTYSFLERIKALRERTRELNSQVNETDEMIFNFGLCLTLFASLIFISRV